VEWSTRLVACAEMGCGGNGPARDSHDGSVSAQTHGSVGPGLSATVNQSTWLVDSISMKHDWPQLGTSQQKQEDEQDGCPSRGRRATGENSKVTCSLCGECERAAG